MEQIFLAYVLPKEPVTPIMMLYKDAKTMVRSSDGDTNFFDIITGVLQADIFAPYMFMTCVDYVWWTSIDLIKDCLTLNPPPKKKTNDDISQKLTDADDLTFLANTPAPAESLLHSHGQAARGIGLDVNANKTEFEFLNEELFSF